MPNIFFLIYLSVGYKDRWGFSVQFFRKT